MKRILPRPRKVALDTTDDCLTDHGGLTFLMAAARRLQLIPLLSRFLFCKRRQRGASDVENLWSLIATLACGDGTLQDQDRLKGSRANRALLGLRHVAGSRRMGEWLSKLTTRHADSLRGLATRLARLIAPTIIAAEVKLRGYAPVFVDGTMIEVKGKNFVGAKYVYTKKKALWLYAAFIGRLQISSRLCAATGDAAGNWRKQLKRDVVPLIPAGTPVWAAVDNAYFRSSFARCMEALGWDFSISVTNDRVKAKIVALIDANAVWTPLPKDPDADTREVIYKPSKWDRGYRCIVVRRWVKKDGETELFPTYTVVMTSSRRLARVDVLKRHWQKQGFENGFKGPLREMNLHHPPTKSLGGNQVYYLCGLIAQMLLTYLQYTMLPADAQKAGLRPLIRDLMRSVTKLTRSGGCYRLRFGVDHGRMAWLKTAMKRTEQWWSIAPG